MLKRVVRPLALLALLGLPGLPAHAASRFRVELSEIANLTYQLDCLGGFVSCVEEDYKALWDERFLKTPEDRKQLAEWEDLRQRYQLEVSLPASEDSPLIPRHSEINLFVKLRIAGLQAADLEDYLSRLELLVAPADRTRFARVLRHFLPSFDTWWQAEALPRGRPMAQKIEALLGTPEVAGPLARIERFYAPALDPESTLRLALMARPARASENTSGQQVESTAVVEFLPDERPEDRIDVVIHELCHFFFDSAADGSFAELQKRFAAAGRPAATPAYNLLNEALATALGNGMIGRAVLEPEEFEKTLAREGSFYNYPNVDRAGKALLPVLDLWLAEGRTLFDPQFVDVYIRTLESAFGDSLLAPQLFLNEMYLMVDARVGTGLARPVRQALHSTSVYSEEAAWSEPGILADYRKNPRLNAVFLVHPENVMELANRGILPLEEVKAIAQRAAQEGKALYAFERAPGTYIFVLVAKDAETAKALAGQLAGARKGFLGFYAGEAGPAPPRE